MKSRIALSFPSLWCCALVGICSGWAGTTALAGCSFATNYFSSVTFTDVLESTTMTVAFDGTNYWSCSGGSSSGARLARYDASFGLIATYSPGLDFRSVFTDQSGIVYARAISDSTIYRQTTPGVFTNSGVALAGGSLNAQSSVVLNAAGNEYLAMSGGVVSRWETNGSYIGGVTLSGFGGVSGENTYPQNRGIAAVGDFWLTYNGAGILSVWDVMGNRLAQTTLSGAGTSFDSGFSLSYCDGRAFIVDDAGGLWRGYKVCSSPRVAVFGAPSTDEWNTDVQAKIMGTGLFAGLDAFLVKGLNPVPTLADLSRYQSVLVYTDTALSDSVAMGDVLADYVDQGGGVVLCTFGYNDISSYSIQGRIKSGGYLPFSTSGDSTGASLNLVANLPAHPILDAVATFSGGSASFHNSPITVTNGAVLVAHWSDGQPLVAAKEMVPGRVVGLNFYPPSSDARSDFWDAGTDGALLMANALLWGGKMPPDIPTDPSDQAVEVGAPVSFSAGAIGSPPLSYQWRKDGVDIPDATNSTYALTAQLSDAGSYRLTVTNPYGMAFSSSASLTIIPTATLTLNVTDKGWYDVTGFHNPVNANYVAGQYNGGTNPHRNWFLFELPVLAGPVAAAELRLKTYGIVSHDGSETYVLRKVSTPPGTLAAGGSGLTNIYADLGEGTLYSARELFVVQSARTISIELNEAARTQLTAASGGQFALGGDVVSLGSGIDEYLFGGSGGPVTDVQLVLTIGTGDRPVGGYFTDNYPATTGPERPLLSAGFKPLHITDISTQDLSGVRLLMIDEPNSGGMSGALSNRWPDVENWVRAGGRLAVHDHSAGNVDPNPFLFGAEGSGTVRLFTSMLDTVPPANTLVTVGPFGIVDDITLDGGNYSAHGYVPAGGLPPGSRPILQLGTNAEQVAGFSFPLGAGFIYYSTIPLSTHLLAGGGSFGDNLRAIYAPNVLSYLHRLDPLLHFLPPAQTGPGELEVFLANLDGTPLAADMTNRVRVYASTDAALPFGGWTLFPGPLVPTNGLLRVDGISTSLPAQFLRAEQTP